MEIRPYISVFGCFLIHFGLGTFPTFGNLNPYLTSYLRNRVDGTVTYGKVSWWFPEKKSTVIGILTSGYAAAPLLMNYVQTFFVNPNNLAPASDGYFDDPDVLDAIPSVFLLMAGVHGCFLFVGLLLYSEPKSREVEKGLDNTVDIKEVTNENSPGPELVESKDLAVTPQEALKTKQFYLLVITAVCSFHSVTFVNTFYKVFGQSFIHDDTFLASVGSVSSAFHALSRGLIGVIQQKTSYKSTVLILFGMKTVLLFTLIASSTGGKAMFLIWVSVLYATFPICFVCIPAVNAEVFGMKYTVVIYGMILFMAGASSIVWPVIFTELIPILDGLECFV
ncbi:apicoplast pyruvate carrier 1-like isoform X2 [Tachypleus tridentatus]|uniref:apicoplast pyruvate carrier 1-like isoform X2 n=1 Tax=Tachypleus tridentatus TaxID=6853 RepID=UPI003FD0291F